MHAPAERGRGSCPSGRETPAARAAPKFSFATVPGHAVVADPRHEVRIEVHRIDQAEERAPRIGGRDDRRRRELGAVCERDACDRAVLDEDPLAPRRRFESPRRLRRAASRHGARDGSRAADRRHAAAARHRIGRGGQQQDGARCPPTTVPSRCRDSRARPRSPAADPSRTIRPPDRRPPSVPTAAG